MSDAESLVTVATFDSLPQAELARGLLDAEGIRSFVIDAETVNMAWYISGAVGGIKLQVAKSDFLAAERILNSRQGKSASWGLDDYGLAKPSAITTDPDAVRQEGGEARPSPRHSAITTDPDAVRGEGAPNENEDAIQEDNEAEVMVQAALRAALLGLVFCPPLLHFYSLWLLACVSQLREPLRRRYRKMFWFAVVVDGVVVGGAMTVVALLLIGAAVSGG